MRERVKKVRRTLQPSRTTPAHYFIDRNIRITLIIYTNKIGLYFAHTIIIHYVYEAIFNHWQQLFQICPSIKRYEEVNKHDSDGPPRSAV